MQIFGGPQDRMRGKSFRGLGAISSKLKFYEVVLRRTPFPASSAYSVVFCSQQKLELSRLVFFVSVKAESYGPPVPHPAPLALRIFSDWLRLEP